MLSIQEAGKQILTGNPKGFYVFVGQEYGIKEKYIQSLVDHYKTCKEIDSVNDVLNMMQTKHIIPLSPAVYVIRYDEEFIQSLSDKTLKRIESINIIGTIICIYESSKHYSKCSKYLPNYTVSFDSVNSAFIKKYLKSDFPNLDDRFIDFVVQHKQDYKSAYHMCNSISYSNLDPSCFDDKMLAESLGCNDSSTEKQLRAGIASKNFRYTLSVLESYSDNLDQVFYTILNTLIELDKITSNKYAQSDLRRYADSWTKADIYYMFMNTYEELKRVRSHSSYKVMNSLIYLLSLLQFSSVPAPEVMLCN